MLREALRYPLRGDDAAERLILGGGLHVVTAFVPVVPLVFVVGYLVRVLNEVSDGPSAFRGGPPPGFGDVRALVVDGLKAALVVALYAAGPLAILLVTLGGVSGLSPAALAGTAGVAVLAGSTAALLAALGVAYLLPAALVAYAHSRHLRAAFDRSFLGATATDARYFVAVVAAAGVLSVAALLSSLGAPRSVPRFVGFFVLFYAEVAAAALVGHVAGENVSATRAASE
ncbi:hypothetical protein AUR64_19005 [Haloprofundus marisrubri]|uniref:DUF4013 domain-containing protein n=1 Tax=Haloprofundus marisrubri TaxID=1514971 RepID=A0A0W1R4J7_9EURY|nr:DUF4013 domain-containing protein [Haloprofundus marisrubri]KTG08326.1 hypothetical protein AUR64_19005 [Haloprofundus marisrubri]